jgi:hypothetical protein
VRFEKSATLGYPSLEENKEDDVEMEEDDEEAPLRGK